MRQPTRQRIFEQIGRDVYVHVPLNGGEWDNARIEQAIGEPALPVAPHPLSTIWVGGRVHTAAMAWLRSRTAKEATTLEQDARELAHWIAYLRDTCGYTSHDEGHADVFAATEDDLFAYHTAMQHRRPGGRKPALAPAGWNKRISAIKRFHEYAHKKYLLPTPFTTTTSWHHGKKTTSTGLAARTKRSSAGRPVTPDFANALCQGALRMRNDGSQPDHIETTDRDHAFIQLALGAGVRRHTAWGMTTFELPPARPGSHLNVVNVPDMITKNDAGGAALALEQRLQHVRAYVSEVRRELLDLSRKHHRPDNAIHLDRANDRGWQGHNDNGEKLAGDWASTEMDERLGMVLPDGTSPMLWLSHTDGTPLGYSMLRKILVNARTVTREHIQPDFPASFRLHDLRHTFAVHMVCAIVHRQVARELDGAMSKAYATPFITDAVALVCASLGHSSPEVTRLYLAKAAQMLFDDRIAPTHYLGA